MRLSTKEEKNINLFDSSNMSLFLMRRIFAFAFSLTFSLVFEDW